MAVVFPTVGVYLFIAIIVLAYRDKVKYVFSRDEVSPEEGLSPAQPQRYLLYQNAEALQLAVNKWHNKAIRSKSWYELGGVVACSSAPSLIILSAAAPGLEVAGLASEEGVRIADAIVCAMVLLIIFLFRHPNKPHVDNRMKAEFLRCHLHCLLAKVGPYPKNELTALDIEASIATIDADAITLKLRALERECVRQADVAEALTADSVTLGHADVYLAERVSEQMGNGQAPGYFQEAGDRMRRSYRNSARAFFAIVILATLIGAMRVFFPGIIDSLAADIIYASCGAVAVLIVGLRSVFGWDSKGSLYSRQAERLTNLVKELVSARNEMEREVPGAQLLFCRRAAEFESLMAREASDWKLVSDREYYDVTP
jgi:hypothetical protein